MLCVEFLGGNLPTSKPVIRDAPSYLKGAGRSKIIGAIVVSSKGLGRTVAGSQMRTCYSIS